MKLIFWLQRLIQESIFYEIFIIAILVLVGNVSVYTYNFCCHDIVTIHSWELPNGSEYITQSTDPMFEKEFIRTNPGVVLIEKKYTTMTQFKKRFFQKD